MTTITQKLGKEGNRKLEPETRYILDEDNRKIETTTSLSKMNPKIIFNGNTQNQDNLIESFIL